MWWYELQEYIWQSSENIKFTYNKKNYNFSINTNKKKLKCFNQLSDIIKKLNKTEQDNFLKALTKTHIRKQYKNKLLSKEDLKFLTSNSLVTIGVHSHNDCVLRKVSQNLFIVLTRSRLSAIYIYF